MFHMLDFRSKLRRDLLGYYFTNPHASHYVRELARHLDTDATNLSRELATLEKQGLFQSETRGNQKFYKLNRRYPLYDELRRIIFKTIGVSGELREALRDITGLDEAYLYGSFAENQADPVSDIDVLLVGKPDAEELETAIRRLEKRLNRE